MTISRRSLIKGLISFAAAPAIVRASSLMPVKVMPTELVVYGRSLAMDVLPDAEFLQGLSQRLTQTILYGSSEVMPLQFSGFAAFGPASQS